MPDVLPDSSTEPSLDTPSLTSIVSLTARWVTLSVSQLKMTAMLAIEEAKLAVLSLRMVAIMSALAGLCVIGTWGLLVAASVIGLLAANVPLWMALGSLGICHAVAAVALWSGAARAARHMGFPVTRNHLETSGEAGRELAPAKSRS
jgi:hypothetical protein